MIDLLVVEDQPAVREIISEVVEDLNVPMRIGQASSLKEARELLTNQHWDGLVTDLSLGDGQSLDLIAELYEENIDVPPVILVSGFLSAKRLRQAEELHVHHVLAKPFNPEALLDCIRDALSIEDMPKPQQRRLSEQSNRLLPEMFEMDRKLGLLFRMFDEMPKQKDVSGVCHSALNLAMEMIHAQGGYLALYERNQKKLVRVATQGFSDEETSVATCDIHDTPFSPLIHGSKEYIESLPSESLSAACWPNIQRTSYIAVPVYLQGISMGVLCLFDRASNEPLADESRYMLSLLIKKLDTLLDNRAVHAALAESMNETLIALVRSLEARDRYTKDHSSRVSALAVLFAQTLGLDDDSVQLIKTGGLLHDIGKVGIADSVLLKPGRYNDQEYATMKAHPAIGDSILKNMDTLVRERLIVRHHHERWDGKGYPDKLGSTDIPFEARIVCVADAMDAMTTHRVYRMAKPLSFCAEQLRFNAGSQFDPQVVDVALAAIEQGNIYTQALADETHEEGEGVMPASSNMCNMPS
ncbi:MAG: HD domain-containing response regulator [Mariprofundaceae bacterium]|nr:HD domain-containing response regulator [Mariprofundaceae bacterium]